MAKKALSEILGGVTTFGDYEVIGEGDYSPKVRMCVCRCKCGAIRQVAADKLRSGRSTCCASCAKISKKRATNIRHGMSRTPEYNAWAAMRYRCTNPDCWNYSDYGGRGISVCDRWMSSFDAFYSDMGPRPEGHSLDRIDNDKGYSPKNCRWADNGEQQRNRRVTRKINVNSVDIPISEAERNNGFPRGVLSHRLDMGWSLERALSEPSAIKKPMHNVFGERLSTKEICARFHIDRQAFNRRLRLGWSAEETVSHYQR